MTQMTIGQRIASRRKLQNLSQEALAEQLNVSRQAISKWESDAAIPEIDKLITLSKLFGVSVGWLLGTERDPNFDPSTGLSDAQLKMVEEIVARYQPDTGRFRRFTVLAAAGLIIAAVLFGIYFQRQLAALSLDTADTHADISALDESNRAIQSQINAMNRLLEAQEETSRLLSSIQIIPRASENPDSIEIEFYCFPKVPQVSAAAYISVTNPEAGFHEMLECSLLGSVYWVKTELPAADGYQYSFLLVTDGGYQEQMISLDPPYFADLHTYSHFHLDPNVQSRTVWDRSERTYTCAASIYTPLIPMYDTHGYVGYQEVIIALKRNGEVVWEESCRDSLREHAGSLMRSEDPWMPEITVPLPELAAGDVLTLEITATAYNDLTVTSILETLTVE